MAIAKRKRRIPRRSFSGSGVLAAFVAVAAIFAGVVCAKPGKVRDAVSPSANDEAPATELKERDTAAVPDAVAATQQSEIEMAAVDTSDVAAPAVTGEMGVVEDTMFWTLGTADNSQAEFTEYTMADPEKVRITAESEMDRPGISKGLNGAKNPALEISYELEEVPPHGAEFRFKLLHSHKGGPQMAVFSNGLMAGLIQLWGTAETTSPWPWRKTYRLYIPKELLSAGANTLRLETVRPMWSNPSVDRFLWWEWDYLAMEKLGKPAIEPIHGTVAYLGTTMKHSANDFKVDDDTLRLAPVAMRWMGIAYSGNTIRADFWWDVGSQQSRRREYLELLRDYNMTVIADHVSSNHFQPEPGGALPERMKVDVKRFFEQYGDLFQWYEIANEPCMFGGERMGTVMTAHYVTEIKPAHVKTTAPGWAYGGGKGTPVNWARNAAFRREVERHCQATNGHSYGYSYADNEGGSFVENLETFEGVEDGWPVEYVNTETGTNNWHSEENGPRFASTQPHAQAFDRIMRAHIAVVDRTIQHAAIFDDFGLFNPPTDWRNAETLTPYSGMKGEDCRLKTFRRLALAYATHGAPLAYEFANRADVTGKKVLFRAVDTRAIGALPGSRGTSDKVLLNFVNFESETVTMKVVVTMPISGVWKGERIGAGMTTAEAFTSGTRLKAAPALEITETLAAGEGVQYVLTPPGPARPYAPKDLKAEPDADRVALKWLASTGATAYAVERARVDGGPFALIAKDVAGTEYVDATPAKGVAYRYVVMARNAAGVSSASDPAEATPGAPRVPNGLRAIPADGTITLEWTRGPGVTGWDVKYAKVKAGPYERIAQGLKDPRFVHGARRNGEKAWYVVSAFSDEIESPLSPAVSSAAQVPPGKPTGLSALAADGRVVLSWQGVADATSYNVKRASSARGPFETIGQDVGESKYVDGKASNGTTWHYVVSGLKEGVEGVDSEGQSASPSRGSVPSGWKSADIGSPGHAGTTSYTPASKAWTIIGSGHDVWGDRDGLHYAYLPLSGDGSLSVHLSSYEDTHVWAKIGVAIRESIEPGAAMALMAISPGKGCGFTYRKAKGGQCEMAGGDHKSWLRIERKGNRMIGQISEDGNAWREFAASEIPMGRKAFIGLVVCSHDNALLNAAVFDNVTTSGSAGR